MTDAIREAVRVARERLRVLGLPEDPAERWTSINHGSDMLAQMLLRIDAVVDKLYSVITFGERALAAQAAGDWDGFAAAHETMVGAEISSRLPQITKTLDRQRQRKISKEPRSEAKETARRLYEEHQPKSAKDLLKLLQPDADGRVPKPSTVRDWFTEFRRPKKNSV